MNARFKNGFTLLEVVVALAILGLALMAIFDLNSGAVAMHAYSKRLTVASLLARSKMTDVEQELFDKGFSDDDEEKSGDFSSEGWSSFKWRAKILAPRTQNISPAQLITALFNIPLNPADLGPLGDLFSQKPGGPSSSGSSGPTSSSGTNDALSALGPMAGLIQSQFTQMLDQLSKAVREVHLTVSWQEGRTLETLDLVTHVVSLGGGSDRNGNLLAAGVSAAANAQNALAPLGAPGATNTGAPGVPGAPGGTPPPIQR